MNEVEKELERNFKSFKRNIIKNSKTLMKQIYRVKKERLGATLDFHLITMVYELSECANVVKLYKTLNSLECEYRTYEFTKLWDKCRDEDSILPSRLEVLKIIDQMKFQKGVNLKTILTKMMFSNRRN